MRPPLVDVVRTSAPSVVGLTDRGRVAIGVGLVVLFLAVGAWGAAVATDDPSVLELEFVWTEERAVELLGGASAATIADLRAGVLRDYAWIVTYVAVLSWWCSAGSLWFRRPLARRAALALAALAPVAGALDALENMFLLRLLDARGADGAAARWTTLAAVPKWAMVVPGAVCALAALVAGVRRLRTAGSRPG